MITPLKSNVEISERLVRFMKNFPHEKKMAQTLLISSQMLLLHANDLLDQRIIENNGFVPAYSTGFIPAAILEIVSIIQLTLKSRKLRVFCAINIDKKAVHKFDKRRLQ